MSLMPHLHDEKNYKVLREKLNRGKAEQTFRFEHNIKNAGNHVEKMFIIDAFHGWKFLFNAKFGCIDPGCNNWITDPGCGSWAEVTIFLSNEGVEVKADFDIGIEKPDKSIICLSKETTKSSKNEKFLGGSHVIGGIDETSPFIHPNGAVKFVLTIKITEPAGTVLPMQPKPKIPGVYVKLAEEFSETCLNTTAPPGPLVDVTLHVEGNKIYGHKIILSLTSNYFRRMFETNMEEANKNEVHIDGIDFTTMQSVVKFMYSNSIDENEATLDLLEAADRFGVMRLMEVCGQKMSKTINLENVANIWEISYKHSIEDLTHDCVLFMAKEWKRLAKDDKIVELAKKYCELPMTIASLLTETNNS